jgi:hypothetical protein
MAMLSIPFFLVRFNIRAESSHLICPSHRTDHAVGGGSAVAASLAVLQGVIERPRCYSLLASPAGSSYDFTGRDLPGGQNLIKVPQLPVRGTGALCMLVIPTTIPAILGECFLSGLTALLRQDTGPGLIGLVHRG